uniref:Mediator complex subunit 16 n=1 Tax=Pan paniscus TaxID=9597 RepID=A0A2R9A5D8_PANPA
MCDLRRPAAGGMMDLAYVCEWEKWSKSTHCPSVSTTCGGCTLALAPRRNARPAPGAAVSPCSSRPTGPRR